jgi:hypothetical protein
MSFELGTCTSSHLHSAGKETVYDEESGVYEIKTVAITDHKHAATGEDTTVSGIQMGMDSTVLSPYFALSS